MVVPAEPALKQKAQDMGSLRGPRKSAGGGGKLNSLQIIQQSAQQEMGGKADVNQIINGISALVQMKKMQLIQIGDTVFTVMPKGGGVAEIHTFTVEDPQTLVKRYQAGAKSLKQMGFKQAVSYAESPAFVKIAQQTGLPVKVSQGHQTIGGQTKPTYQFTVDL